MFDVQCLQYKRDGVVACHPKFALVQSEGGLRGYRMEGVLEKLTNNKLGLNYYQRRHFRLEWGKLKYYNRPEDDVEKGSIDLCEMHGAYLSDDDAQRKTIVLLFGNRSVFLLAPDPEEAQAWVYNLRCYTKRTDINEPVAMPRHVVLSLLDLIASCKANGGAQQEGLFRIPGRSQQIKSICRSVYLNRPNLLTAQESRDVESTGGAIKRLLWCLPAPLFTHERLQAMLQADTASKVHDLVMSMPLENRAIMHSLFGLLSEVCINQASTKMTALSLAMCFSPCLSGAETGAIYDMKQIFTILTTKYNEVFDGIPVELDQRRHSHRNNSISIVDCVSKTSSARAITAVLAENGGDIQKTLKRTSRHAQKVWETIRPRVQSSQSTSKTQRPSVPMFTETEEESAPSTFMSTLFTTASRGSIQSIQRAEPVQKTAPVYVSKSMAGGMSSGVNRTNVQRQNSPPDEPMEPEPIPPRIQKQLDHLRNRVQELEERCAYWRNKFEASESARNETFPTETAPLPTTEKRPPPMVKSSSLRFKQPTEGMGLPSVANSAKLTLAINLPPAAPIIRPTDNIQKNGPSMSQLSRSMNAMTLQSRVQGTTLTQRDSIEQDELSSEPEPDDGNSKYETAYPELTVRSISGKGDEDSEEISELSDDGDSSAILPEITS